MSKQPSREENLTLLIGSIFDSIERDASTYLTYGTVNMRGALERFFYFSAVNRPESLWPLLRAGRKWRASTQDEGLSDFYDDWLTGGVSRESFFSRVSNHLKAMLHWVFLRSMVITSSIKGLLNKQSSSKDSLPIAFFAFSDRFAYFFKDTVQGLGAEQCIFLSTNGLVRNDVIEEIGAKLIGPSGMALPRGGINLRFWHPLFPSYLLVLRKFATNLAMLQDQRPGAVVFAEGSSMEDHVIALAAKYLDIPTLRMQCGRAGILHSGYRNMCFDQMLCWGSGFVKRFIKYSPTPQYVITGSPLLDNIRQPIQLAESSRSHTVSIFTQPVSPHISSDDYQQLVAMAEALMMDEKIGLLVRKHPVDQDRRFDDLAGRYPLRIKMMNIEHHALADVLEASVAAVGFFSTTLSEAAAYGVIPVILKLRDQHSVFPYPEKHGAAMVAENVDEAVACISRVIHQPMSLSDVRERMKEFSREYFGPQDGQAMKRVIESIRTASKKNRLE